MLSSALHRYPIQKPELGCYGHSENVRGVRNYGKRDASELFDVYCFASAMQGETKEHWNLYNNVYSPYCMAVYCVCSNQDSVTKLF